MLEPPSGAVTFLFTDIEGSTQLWESAPEAMRPALEQDARPFRYQCTFPGGLALTAKCLQVPETPLSSCSPRSWNSIPEPGDEIRMFATVPKRVHLRARDPARWR
jgi:Adenylate and Guanylate cyclase catalytic domain